MTNPSGVYRLACPSTFNIASLGCRFEASGKGTGDKPESIFDSIDLIGQSNKQSFSAAVSIVCFVSFWFIFATIIKMYCKFKSNL